MITYYLELVLYTYIALIKHHWDKELTVLAVKSMNTERGIHDCLLSVSTTMAIAHTIYAADFFISLAKSFTML